MLTNRSGLKVNLFVQILRKISKTSEEMHPVMTAASPFARACFYLTLIAMNSSIAKFRSAYYRDTLPLASPPISFSTSSIVDKLASPKMVCFKHEAATAKSRAF